MSREKRKHLMDIYQYGKKQWIYVLLSFGLAPFMYSLNPWVTYIGFLMPTLFIILMLFLKYRLNSTKK